MSLRTRAQSYPVVVRIINRTVVATIPDLEIPIPVSIHLGTDELSSADTLLKVGRAVRLAYAAAEGRLEDYRDLEKEAPTPSKPRELIPSPPQYMSLSEACRMTGLKPDALRALADSGIVKATRTAGMHRRFLRTSLAGIARGSPPESESAEEGPGQKPSG